MNLTLPYPPSANRYWRNFRGRMVVSSEAKQYQSLVFKAWMQVKSKQDRMFPSDPVALTISLHPRAPKRKTSAPVRCLDLDNCIKVTLDALQGIAYANDRQVVEIIARRGEPVEGGALVVSWEPAQPVEAGR